MATRMTTEREPEPKPQTETTVDSDGDDGGPGSRRDQTLAPWGTLCHGRLARGLGEMPACLRMPGVHEFPLRVPAGSRPVSGGRESTDSEPQATFHCLLKWFDSNGCNTFASAAIMKVSANHVTVATKALWTKQVGAAASLGGRYKITCRVPV